MTDSEGDGDLGAALRRPGGALAAVAAAGVFAVLFVQQALLGIVNTVAVSGLPGDSAVGHLWLGQLHNVLGVALPLSIGVFLSLWQLAPIAPESRLVQVILRALAATAVGALLVVIVVVISALMGALTGVTFFGNSFPDLGGPLRAAWYSVISGVAGAGRASVVNAPVVVLAAVLLWGWLQRRGTERSVGGADEV